MAGPSGFPLSWKARRYTGDTPHWQGGESPWSKTNKGPSGGVTAHLTIRDGKAADAIDFYRRAFDASEVGRHMAEDGRRIMHAHLKINGGSLMLNDEFPEFMSAPTTPPGSLVLHLQVPDADAAWQKALAAGAKERFPMADQFWGDRYGQVQDPFGFTWSIGAPSRKT